MGTVICFLHSAFETNQRAFCSREYPLAVELFCIVESQSALRSVLGILKYRLDIAVRFCSTDAMTDGVMKDITKRAQLESVSSRIREELP